MFLNLDKLGGALIGLFLIGSFLLIPLILGYKIGAKRITGSVVGLLAGLCFSYLGVIVLYFMPRKTWATYPQFQNYSVADEIKKFKELADSGAITEQEYQLQKVKLLNK